MIDSAKAVDHWETVERTFLFFPPPLPFIAGLSNSVSRFPIHLEQRLKEQPIPARKNHEKLGSDQPLLLSPVLKLPLPLSFNC